MIISSRYSRTAIVLHRALAFANLGLFGVGLYMAGSLFSFIRLRLYKWHKSAGVTLFAWSALHRLWRVTYRPPALPANIADTMSAWENWMHNVTHYVLYALFFVVPMIGWAYTSAAGFPIVLFGIWPLRDLKPADTALSKPRVCPGLASATRECAPTITPRHSRRARRAAHEPELRCSG